MSGVQTVGPGGPEPPADIPHKRTMTELLDGIQDIRRLALNPDDIIVVRVPKHISRQDAERTKDHLRRYFPTQQILVLADGVTLDVVAPEKPASATNDGRPEHVAAIGTHQTTGFKQPRRRGQMDVTLQAEGSSHDDPRG